MKRREFITVIGGALAWPFGARAQQLGRTYRVGLLAPGPLGPLDDRRRSILEVLASRGFVEGRNLLFEVRSGNGRHERLSELAAELKASKFDVIITFGYPAALAAKTSAQDVPIVVMGSGDPIATGLADGLARPFRAIRLFPPLTQGVALGCLVVPFQGGKSSCSLFW